MADRYEEKAREILREHGRDWCMIDQPELLAGRIASALRDQDTWYEIDDPEHPAPRDGTDLIGLAKDANVFRIWHGQTPRGAPAWVSYAGAFVDGYITHYRPLPAPPLSGRKPGPSPAAGEER